MKTRLWMTCVLIVLAAFVSGCGTSGTGSSPAQPAGANANVDGHDGHSHGAPSTTANSQKNHDHSGWWCGEHGIPEGVCAQCNSKLAADFQKKGDWCADHDRPDSQCFECHPELEAKFAAQYEAKFGEKPPKPQG